MSPEPVGLTERVPTPLPRAVAEAIAARFPHDFHVAPTWHGEAIVTPRGVVGEFDAADRRIVVAPKHPLGRLAQLVPPQPTESHSGDAPPQLVELVATRFLQALQSHPWRSDYHAVAESSVTIRGRIDFVALARQPQGAATHPILADDFSLGQPKNQASVAALHRLLTLPLLPPLRERLRHWQRRLAGVTPRTPELRDWQAWDSGGDELLTWTRIVLTGCDAGGAGYLIRLEPLFEQAVRDTFHAVLPSGHRLTRPRLTLAGGSHALHLRPDCVIESPAGAVTVFDAKWKRLSRTGPDARDVQQLLAYQSLLGITTGGLVYPGRRSRRERLTHRHGELWLVTLGLESPRSPGWWRRLATPA